MIFATYFAQFRGFWAEGIYNRKLAHAKKTAYAKKTKENDILEKNIKKHCRLVAKLCEFMSARHAALPVKNFPVARQSDPSPPKEVNNPASAINLKKMVTQQSCLMVK